ncbi:MFS transporter [Phenylobacterium sp. LjRoot219]|uniref:MFS transporter n=1 Tax=Phenylobacterium sp. LjRoot219 TaxID=3342283 RepID=UPI003ECD7E53
MSYLGEFRANWRALLAAALGLGGGTALHIYSLSVFAPPLLAEFGWTKAQFALVGVIGMLTLVTVPVAGRLADSFGVRRTAAFGVFGVPACFFAYSLMRGGFTEFLAITVALTTIGATTTSSVYSRLVAERFEKARGLALAVVVCGPAAVSALGIPVLSHINDVHGWRVGYQAVAALSLCFGLLALTIMPRSTASGRTVVRAPGRMLQDYRQVAGRSAFWVILAGMLLCNIAAALPASHMKLMLLDKGASSAVAAMIISSYSTGVIIGRFACGLSLDRFPPHIVAAVSMGLPALGLFILGSPIDATVALAAAVLLLGLSQGAEGDLAAYLVVRFFGIQVFSSTLGLVTAAIGSASAIGALVMGATLKLTDDFTVYLYICTAATFIGSLLFMLLGRPPKLEPVLAPQGA